MIIETEATFTRRSSATISRAHRLVPIVMGGGRTNPAMLDFHRGAGTRFACRAFLPEDLLAYNATGLESSQKADLGSNKSSIMVSRKYLTPARMDKT